MTHRAQIYDHSGRFLWGATGNDLITILVAQVMMFEYLREQRYYHRLTMVMDDITTVVEC